MVLNSASENILYSDVWYNRIRKYDLVRLFLASEKDHGRFDRGKLKLHC